MTTDDELDDTRVRAALSRILSAGEPFTVMPLVDPDTLLFPDPLMGALDARYPADADFTTLAGTVTTLGGTLSEQGADIDGLTTDVGDLSTLTSSGRLGTTALNATIAAGVSATAVPVGKSISDLANWRRKLRDDPANAKLGLGMDSRSNGSTGPSPALYARLAGISLQSTGIPSTYHTAAGQGLYGMTADTSHFIDGGNSGMKLQTYLADYDANVSTAKSLRWMLAQSLDLIIIDAGTNDIRLGERTPSQISADLVRLVTIWRTDSPATDVLLITPGTFSTTNVASNDYVKTSPTGTVNPAGLAQTYSTQLRQVYLALANKWPNVVVLDAQAGAYGTKSIAYSSSGMMGDQIHLSTVGNYAKADLIVSAIGATERFKPLPDTVGRATAALSPYAPWSIDPAVLDDPQRFVRVAYGETSTDTVAGTRQSFTWPTAQDIYRWDIVRMPDGTVYQIPTGSSEPGSQNGPTTRISSASAVANQAGILEVFRQIKTGDDTMDRTAFLKSKRFRKFFRIVSATSTTATLRLVTTTAHRDMTTPSELAAMIVAGNQLFMAGDGANPTTLTGGQWSASGNDIVITGLTTDYSAYTGRMAAIVGTQTESAPGPTGATGPTGKVTSALRSRFWAGPSCYGSASTGALTANLLYLIPFVPDQNGSIDQMGIEVTTAASAGGVARFGVYSSDSDGKPATLLGGDVTVATDTTGWKKTSAFTAVAVTSGSRYFLAVVGQVASATVRTVASGIDPTIIGGDFALSAAGCYGVPSTSGALPSTVTISIGGTAYGDRVPYARAHAA